MTDAVTQNYGDWVSFKAATTFSLHLFSLPAAGHVAESSTAPHDPQRYSERDTRQEGYKCPGSGSDQIKCNHWI